VPASGRGTLHTWTVIHQRYPNSFEDGPATNVAVVQLAEGPFLHTKLVDYEPARLRIGLPVEVVFVPVTDEFTLPCFRPAEPSRRQGQAVPARGGRSARQRRVLAPPGHDGSHAEARGPAAAPPRPPLPGLLRS
jgi:hypothetical protein